MAEGSKGAKTMQEANPVWWRGSTEELLDPILWTARYLSDPSQHRDARTERQDAGVGQPNFRRQAPKRNRRLRE